MYPWKTLSKAFFWSTKAFFWSKSVLFSQQLNLSTGLAGKFCQELAKLIGLQNWTFATVRCPTSMDAN
jgi:hypothetical protein